MAKKITVTIDGEVSNFNKKLYSERLAISLLGQYGEDVCRNLLPLLKERMSHKDDKRKITA